MPKARKRTAAATVDTASASAKKKAKKNPPSGRSPTKEKRACRYRSKCPQGLLERIGRASTQRLYLVDRDQNLDENSTSCGFRVLGSTGNLYSVVLEEVPSCDCPDFQRKHDLCKHILFVTLKVIGLSVDDPLTYQKAYVPSELSDLFSRILSRSVGGSVLANDSVRTSYARLKTGEAADNDGGKVDPGTARRRPIEEGSSDCPICFDSMLNDREDKVVYCIGTCGTNFHADCINRWSRQQHGPKTCPNCRQPWISTNDGNGDSSSSPSTAIKEGYVNLGRLQGQSPVRDTSTYHHRSYGYSRYYRR